MALGYSFANLSYLNSSSTYIEYGSKKMMPNVIKSREKNFKTFIKSKENFEILGLLAKIDVEEQLVFETLSCTKNIFVHII